MESLTDTTWDLAICGTGLQQSLLALALSRSGKKIIHLDPNEYYGGSDAAFSLQEADAWVSRHGAFTSSPSLSPFRNAEVTRSSKTDSESTGLGFSRAYSLCLSPQIVYANSKLLAQLVSSRAYRQLEFLAVGSFFVLHTGAPVSSNESSETRSKLSRIPSTREDVFSSTELSARAKRQLMKLLKLVLTAPGEHSPSTSSDDKEESQWGDCAERPLVRYLQDKLGLDAEVRTYISALTLSLNKNISTNDGMTAIRRHLTSMGMFGVGFAAVYPKWGGASEIAQVACRACAVGGGVYMLGTGIEKAFPAPKGTVRDASDEAVADELHVRLSSNVTIKTRMLLQASKQDAAEHNDGSAVVSRLVAIIDSPLLPLFETTTEGAPAPGVAVIAIIPDAAVAVEPIYAMVHSSDTGECPTGQCVMYLSTMYSSQSRTQMANAVISILAAVRRSEEEAQPRCIWQMYYEHKGNSAAGLLHDKQSNTMVFKSSLPTLSFDDSVLDSVRAAWQVIMGADPADEEKESSYMKFEDREGGDDDDGEGYMEA